MESRDQTDTTPGSASDLHHVEIRGARLAYEMGGDRAPLLLIHPFPFDHTIWEAQVRAFGPSRRLVMPDLAGFGASGTVGRATIAEHADDMAALLDALSISRVVVVGLSMGGYVALAMWRRHKNRLAALVLADTLAVSDTPEAADRRARMARVVSGQGLEPLASTLPGELVAERASAELRRQLSETILRQPVDGVIAALGAMGARLDSTGELASISIPTLVMVGSEDTVTPAEVVSPVAEAIPGAHFALVPGAGHLSSIEEPGAFNAILRTFLDELDGDPLPASA